MHYLCIGLYTLINKVYTLTIIDRKKQKQDSMNIIEKYFPHLTDEQKKQFAALDGLYRDWNAKINVISRKDIDNLYEHHVLHYLAIAKAINFRPGSDILDFGCGGGCPGIPLAMRWLALSDSRTWWLNTCAARTRKASTTSW